MQVQPTLVDDVTAHVRRGDSRAQPGIHFYRTETSPPPPILKDIHVFYSGVSFISKKEPSEGGDCATPLQLLTSLIFTSQQRLLTGLGPRRGVVHPTLSL